MPLPTHDEAGRRRGSYRGTILLNRALRRHGGTIDEFAKDVLGRSRVSIWRWQRKTHAIPEAVVARLKAYLKETAHAG